MDETQPLLAVVSQPINTTEQDNESFDHRIDFNPNGDPENPLEWPKAYRNGVILLLAFMSFTVYVFPNIMIFTSPDLITPTFHQPNV